MILSRLNFYLRLVLMLLWMMLSSLIVLPLAIIRYGNLNNNYLYTRIFGPLSHWILGIRTEIKGLEYLESHQPCIYAVNHQSGADMSIFSEVFPRQTVVIGKKEVIYIPFWGQMYVAFGNIIIDRKDVKNSVAGLNKAAELVKKKSLSVWIFPEGTRNQSGVGLLPFKKGAFHLALQAQVPIVPIVASNLNPVLNFKERKVHGGTLKVQILSPISTHGMRIDQVNELMNSVREQMLVAKSQLDS